MSLARPYSPQTVQTANPTWGRFQKALFLTAFAVTVSCLFYLVEKYLFHPRRRFLESPVEVVMRAFGVAHFLVGWLFLLTSARLRSGKTFIRLGVAGLLGAGACWLYGSLGGSKEPFVLLAFYALFLIHEVRDECDLARQDGTIPVGRFADALASFVIVLLLLALAGLRLARGWMLLPEQLPEISEAVAWGIVSAVALLLGGLVWRLVRTANQEHGSLNAALETHGSLLQVYQALALILIVGSLLGSVGLNLVILIHVTVWLVFVAERVKPEEGKQKRWSAWFRSSPAGFLALHLGLVVVMMILFAVRVHLWERAGWFSAILSSSSFPYWSLLHIFLAFGGKK